LPTIAIYNFKGGVGKTTAAVNFAYLASLEKNKVLLWDFDPQGSASFFCSVKAKIKGGAKSLLEGKSKIMDAVMESDYPNLDILPADFSIRNMDIILEETKKSGKKLRVIIDSFRKRYDYTFIDCPPGLSQLSEHIFRSADYFLVPVIPSTLSIRTYHHVLDYFKKHDLNANHIYPFFSMVDIRKNLHKEVMKSCFVDDPNFLKSFIKSSSDIEKMGMVQKPLTVFAGNSKSSLAFSSLWKEIKKRIH
jgi:cellulose biosynthesis protein BcsQ